MCNVRMLGVIFQIISQVYKSLPVYLSPSWDVQNALICLRILCLFASLVSYNILTMRLNFKIYLSSCGARLVYKELSLASANVCSFFSCVHQQCLVSSILSECPECPKIICFYVHRHFFELIKIYLCIHLCRAYITLQAHNQYGPMPYMR